MRRRTLVRGSVVALFGGGLAGCLGESKAGYLGAVVETDVAKGATVRAYETIDWSDKGMVQTVVEEAYYSSPASMSVEGDQYQEAKRQLEALEARYVEYEHSTIEVYLATEE
jgi:hypothetical protein